MPLKGEAKKAYQREYMRSKRSNKKPVRPSEDVRPLLDPPVRPMLRPPESLPNCPDGRYRPFSKEEQLSVKATKKRVNKEDTFNKLKTKYDVRPT